MPIKQCAATEECQKILINSRDYNVEHSILPSENIIIERLLASRENMENVYIELYESLTKQQIEVVLSLVLSCGAFWNPEKAASYRIGREKLVDINREIAKVARQLADLLKKRDDLHNHSSFSSDTHYCILNVIEDSSKENYLYSSYIKEQQSPLMV